MTLFPQRMGGWIVRWRLAIVILWLGMALAGLWTARYLPQHVIEGSAPLASSASQRVEQALRDDFGHPLVEPLVLAFASERHTVDEPVFRSWIETAAARLEALAEVRQATTPPPDSPSSLLRSREGHRALLLIDLQANDPASGERAVPRIRAALGDLARRMQQDEPGARMALTGRAAASYDNYQLNRSEGERAERLALPWTLVALLFCFGSLAAAALPLAVGLAATSMALGLGTWIASAMPVSGLLVNVAKMLGLALGIDYALLMLSRWRELAPNLDPGTAVAIVLEDAGATIACSGLAVMVGLAGLLFTPLLETRSIGLAGLMVAAVAVAAALTLLPALLTLLGPRLDWPAPLSRLLARAPACEPWARLASMVTTKPLRTLALACAITACIALPGLGARSGFDAGPGMFPASMESRIGEEIVSSLGHGPLTLPLHVLVRSRNGAPLLERRAQLEAWVGRLEQDPRIARVLPPLLAFDAGLGDASLSRDRSAVLLQVFAKGPAELATVQALARDIALLPAAPSLQVEVGGPPVYYADHVEQVQASLVPVFAFVTSASLLLLFISFRSWLLPLKALMANLLAVAAGYGAVVAVFQFGWLASWFGVERPLAAIAPIVPLLVFCLCFGLSMDYEVFLLRAVQRAWRGGASTDAATAQALVGTAPVITGAALVMVLVFSSYAATDVMLLKMLGLGLAVTVLVDATLIRCLLVPALLCVAGEWNWLPGARPQAPRLHVEQGVAP